VFLLYEVEDVVVVVLLSSLLLLLLLLSEVLAFEFASCAALATSLEFCSKVCAVFGLISNIFFIVSFESRNGQDIIIRT
jgi:hypothetical protein